MLKLIRKPFLFSFVTLKLASFIVGSAETFDNNKVIVIKKIKEKLINFINLSI
ncbi:hypothetical protein OAN01_01225 [Candidatus Pelagibacter sp.]|jgi:hypothetical protein|nr:hypothetical protein [Candidatus Pelagibacter sp.]